MRYYYATLHQCDSCGKTEMVPQPCDLRTMDSDPRPPGWGMPKELGLVVLNSPQRIHLADICESCMQLPIQQIIENSKKRYEQ